ncbi:MAG TPA: chitinase [Chthoniobacteraceae bacterium]|jgi:hypothetical protein|nr:chitinase [Chthoniobacteraceae bacterium]
MKYLKLLPPAVFICLHAVSAGAQIVWPARTFAPYVDMNNDPAPSLPDFAHQSGQRFYAAAFVISDLTQSATGAPAGIPAWGGQTDCSVRSGYLASQFAQLRAMGGDVRVSFGGEAGTELAEYIPNIASLTAAYQSVIDQYSLTQVDFDIEGKTLDDQASVNRRSAAIKQLQTTASNGGKTLNVWLTLPVEPAGMPPDSIYAVESALKAGVTLAGINIMTMDFGDAAAPRPKGMMGSYAIASATSACAQLQALYRSQNIALSGTQLWGMLGITPMIGVNDNETEVFTLPDAWQVVNWARQQGVGYLGYWSEGRDAASKGAELGRISSNRSGISQPPHAFAEIFETFQGGNPPPRRSRYKLHISGTDAAAGSAALIVGSAENAALAGRLPDGQLFSATGGIESGAGGSCFPVNEVLNYPFTVPKNSKGSLVGNLIFTGSTSLSGTLEWTKPEQKSGKNRPAANATLTVTGSNLP